VRDETWNGVRERVLSFIGRGWDANTADAEFDDIARFIFQFQFEHNAPYRSWCDRRRRTPDTIRHWTEIPAVPTGAFREVALVCGTVADAQAVFRTSGTTHGGQKRGSHYVRDLDLYHASLRSSFDATILCDGARPAMLSLLPRASEMPDSSLVHMVDNAIATYGGGGSGNFATLAGGIDAHGLDKALRDSENSGAPVCLLGTSLSFVHWLEVMQEAGRTYRLPAGSRLMDTGGFKGRSRAVPEEELRAAYGTRLGIGETFCINEYGMTEMASQFYDSALRDHHEEAVVRDRRKLGPAWVRSRVVDPDTLMPLPPGGIGLLQHFDVANAGSVLAIQTEDLGVQVTDGFTLLGRATGAAPRGCSIAMDELLAAARG
jgi:hypothetical protein